MTQLRETADMVEEMAELLWIEQGHRKPWGSVAEPTKEHFRKLALDELSAVFCQ